MKKTTNCSRVEDENVLDGLISATLLADDSMKLELPLPILLLLPNMNLKNEIPYAVSKQTIFDILNSLILPPLMWLILEELTPFLAFSRRSLCNSLAFSRILFFASRS